MKVSYSSKKTALILIGSRFTQRWLREQPDVEKISGFEKSAEDSKDDVKRYNILYCGGIIFILIGIGLIGYGFFDKILLAAYLVFGFMSIAMGGLFLLAKNQEVPKKIDRDILKYWSKERERLLRSRIIDRLAQLLQEEGLNHFCSKEKKDWVLINSFDNQCKILSEKVRELESCRENEKREVFRKKFTFLHNFAKDVGIKLPDVASYFPRPRIEKKIFMR